MKSLIEKINLLSLSLMMISPFSVSPALPKMIAYYQKVGYQTKDVELLFSLSSFAILVILLLNPLISRLLSEKITIILGLLLLSAGGSIPVLIQDYPLVFLSRIFLGLGIGLINAKAINIISERFKGKERIRMLGFRASAEVLGSAVFTFLAGYLIGFDWSFAYVIYAFGFLILMLYLLAVSPMPTETTSPLENSQKNTKKASQVALSAKQILYIFSMALYAGFVILINTLNTLRIPQVIDRLQLGSASQASLILGLMMLMGILSGLSFSRLLSAFRDELASLVVFVLGLGMLVLWQGNSLFLVSLGALSTGFVYSIGVTYIFNALSEKIPSHQLTLATTLVLIGCNIGGGSAALVSQLLSVFSQDLRQGFLIFAILSFLLSVLLYGITKGKKKQS
ncbi:MFS transporter [Streptococcus ictaluri]|uniref:Transporter, major facilitator family protein n=1 Tax=Streptococcus ictaluri 707-05 TaxID=764299 RepID=G5JZS1_9STRE|nr:MFS transporter [Streptococcus ictaluri]EHI70893.1 transporter, major facilitator family protein [Streptococcus ictaluri 707-05]